VKTARPTLDAIEQELAEIDAKPNALDPAKPTPTGSFD
jgi:hypothetical protein